MNSPSLDIRIRRSASARQQVAAQLREMILSGKAPEGAKLPATGALANQLGVAYKSVHAAMTMLAREGLVERTRRLGTFVSRRSRELTSVGIYVGVDIWRHPEAAFRRVLVSLLNEQLSKKGITVDMWADPRLPDKHGSPWSSLVRAASQRRVQGFFIFSALRVDHPWLSRLPVPLVGLNNRVEVDVIEGARLAVDELAKMGCRSVGLISPGNLHYFNPQLGTNIYARAMQAFGKRALELGLEMRDQWFLYRADGTEIEEGEAERFGYEMMKQLLALPQRPQGLYVHYDWIARGALTAILEHRLSIPQDLKLVFARNREIRWLCPVPAAFVETSVEDVAKAMVDMLLGQSRGEQVPTSVALKPIVVPAASSGNSTLQESMNVGSPA